MASAFKKVLKKQLDQEVNENPDYQAQISSSSDEEEASEHIVSEAEVSEIEETKVSKFVD